jgi:hypothetical protein
MLGELHMAADPTCMAEEATEKAHVHPSVCSSHSQSKQSMQGKAVVMHSKPTQQQKNSGWVQQKALETHSALRLACMGLRCSVRHLSPSRMPVSNRPAACSLSVLTRSADNDEPAAAAALKPLQAFRLGWIQLSTT